VTRDKASAVGTMIMGSTQDKGLRVGRVMAMEGIPGSMDNQVEQTVARGWAVRPESARAVEVVKDRRGAWNDGAGRVLETMGGSVATSEAG
jgi:hypothetical protein